MPLLGAGPIDVPRPVLLHRQSLSGALIGGHLFFLFGGRRGGMVLARELRVGSPCAQRLGQSRGVVLHRHIAVTACDLRGGLLLRLRDGIGAFWSHGSHSAALIFLPMPGSAEPGLWPRGGSGRVALGFRAQGGVVVLGAVSAAS